MQARLHGVVPTALPFLLLAFPAEAAGPAFVERLLPLVGVSPRAAPVGPPTDERPGPGGAIVVTEDAWSGIHNPNDGRITLFEAIGYASSDSLPNVIRFDPSLAGKPIRYLGWNLPAMTGNGDQIVGDFGSDAPQTMIEAGITVQNADGCVIRSLCLPGITLSGATNCKVKSCHLGLAPDGKTRFPTKGIIRGVTIESTDSAHPAKGNVIGGGLLVERNYFGASSPGVGGGPWLSGEWTSDNWVYNNYVGLEHDGVTPLATTPWGGVTCTNGAHDNHIGDWPNRWNSFAVAEQAVTLEGAKTRGNIVRSNYLNVGRPAVHAKYGIAIQGGAHDNTIGGAVDAEHLPNVIGNCDEAGVLIESGCNNNTVTGGCIGLDQWGGAIAGGGGKVGISVGANTTGTSIGGSTAAWRNWIAGQSVAGIDIGAGATKVTIRGNWLGFDKARKPAGPGVGIRAVGAKQVTIGRAAAAPGLPSGNVISGWTGHAVSLKNCTGPITLEANLLGLDPTRRSVLANKGSGLYADNCSNLLLGASSSSASVAPAATTSENVIVNSGGYGVVVSGSKAQGATVVGNWIGVFAEAGGSEDWTAYPNQRGGVLLTDGAYRNTIGAVPPAAPNRICANGGPGVTIRNRAHDNTILQSYVGRAQPDSRAPGNRIAGILISSKASRNTIGSSHSLSTVWIAGNRGPGVWITDGDTGSNVIRRAAIGVGTTTGALTGAVPDGNLGGGVLIDGDAWKSKVGVCDHQGYPVVISGNRSFGVRITGASTMRNDIVRCRIGTTPDGTRGGSAWANQGPGVELRETYGNSVGDASGFGNQIANNQGPGVLLIGSATHVNWVMENLIGTTADGLQALPNRGPGVEISGGSENFVGTDGPQTPLSPGADRPNLISGNRGHGVSIHGKSAQKNEVAYNYIGCDRLGRKALPNQGAGISVTDGANRNTLGQLNVICGNQQEGIAIIGRGADINQIKGNIIGLGSRSLSPVIPNGSALAGVGVSIRAKSAQEWPPFSASLSGNAIVAAYGVVASGSPTVACSASLIENHIGLVVSGKPRGGLVGVQGRNATLHVLETTIRNQSSAGVEVSGTKANAWVFENRFEDNSRHVVFADSATGNLGEVGLGTTLNGKNRFRHSTLWAVDAYGYAAGKTLKAELNDWGTASRSAIEGRIRFRIGDARHVSVDFDPLIGNVHPKALTLAAAGGPPPAVTGLSVFAAQGGATIVFALSAPGTATVEVLSPAGRRLHTLWSARPCSGGTNTLGWNGLGDNGLRVPSGTYLVRVIVRGADGRQAQATAPLRCRR